MLYPLSYRGVLNFALPVDGRRGCELPQGCTYCNQCPAFCQCGTINFPKSPVILPFRLLQLAEGEDIILFRVNATSGDFSDRR